MTENNDLREAGLKVTLPRLRVLHVLEQDREGHLSAEDVYQALRDAGEDVSLATVYRVLTQFEAAGLVRRHNFEGGHAVFELESGEHHDHIICTQCGAVVEFVDPTIERRQEQVAERHGFRVTDHTMVIYGECVKPRCPRRSPARKG